VFVNCRYRTGPIPKERVRVIIFIATYCDSHCHQAQDIVGEAPDFALLRHAPSQKRWCKGAKVQTRFGKSPGRFKPKRLKLALIGRPPTPCRASRTCGSTFRYAVLFPRSHPPSGEASASHRRDGGPIPFREQSAIAPIPLRHEVKGPVSFKRTSRKSIIPVQKS